jgi:phosphoglycolate phosphatase-like HAD superfamily hydrolase
MIMALIKQLNNYLNTKKYFVFDFDRTLAKMEIDWTDWHKGIANIYAKYDIDHGYVEGKDPHIYHNQLIKKFGTPLLEEAQNFNREYEAKNLTSLTPNTELIQFINNNPTQTFYVYSSNARPTVVKGLTELGIFDDITSIVSKDEVKFVKPNPEGFTLFEKFVGNENLFLMIGDSNSDRGAAHSAGIDFLECSLFIND